MLRCGFSEPVIRDLVKNALGGQGPLCGQNGGMHPLHLQSSRRLPSKERLAAAQLSFPKAVVQTTFDEPNRNRPFAARTLDVSHADIAAQCCCSDTHRGCSTKSLVGSRRCRAGSPKRSSSTAKSVETQTGHSPRRRQMSDMRTKRPDAWSVSYAGGSAPGNTAQPSNLHTVRRAPYLRRTCGLA